MALQTLLDVDQIAIRAAGPEVLGQIWQGENVIANMLARGDFSSSHEEEIIREWLDRQATRRADALSNSPIGLAKRNTVAAERSAKAAEESAASAKKSAIWAKWALAVSATALIVTVASALMPLLSK